MQAGSAGGVAPAPPFGQVLEGGVLLLSVIVACGMAYAVFLFLRSVLPAATGAVAERGGGSQAGRPPGLSTAGAAALGGGLGFGVADTIAGAMVAAPPDRTEFLLRFGVVMAVMLAVGAGLLDPLLEQLWRRLRLPAAPSEVAPEAEDGRRARWVRRLGAQAFIVLGVAVDEVVEAAVAATDPFSLVGRFAVSALWCGSVTFAWTLGVRQQPSRGAAFGVATGVAFLLATQLALALFLAALGGQALTPEWLLLLASGVTLRAVAFGAGPGAALDRWGSRVAPRLVAAGALVAGALPYLVVGAIQDHLPGWREAAGYAVSAAGWALALLVHPGTDAALGRPAEAPLEAMAPVAILKPHTSRAPRLRPLRSPLFLLLALPALVLPLLSLALERLPDRGGSDWSLHPYGTLLADDFRDPERGRLPKALAVEGYRVGYLPGVATAGQAAPPGEYFISAMPPRGASDLLMRNVPLPGVYRDVVLTVETRFSGLAAGWGIAAGCRTDWAKAAGYQLRLAPADGTYHIARVDGKSVLETNPVRLPTRQPSRPGGPDWWRLELRCQRDEISAGVAGATALSIRDTTYRSGALWLGVYPTGGPGAGIGTEVRFSDLRVVQG